MKVLSVLATLSVLLSSCGVFKKSDLATSSLQQSSNQQLDVTFLGTSTFLIESEKAAVLVDGYFTRTQLNLLRGGIRPNEYRVSEMLCGLGLRLRDHRYIKSLDERSECEGNTKQLDAVIVTHGHFDHALDSPLIAALTGAEIVGDRATLRIFGATRRALPLTEELWNSVRFVDVTVCSAEPPFASCNDGRSLEGREKQYLNYGNIDLTLFETPHSTNFFSGLIDQGTARDFDFRTSLFSMKQFVSLSVHVSMGDLKALVVPTAGDLDQRVARHGLQADVLFMGVGGLTLQGGRHRKQILATAAREVSPKRIFPIHWDNFRKPLNLSNPKLEASVVECLERIEQSLTTLSSGSKGFEVLWPPVGIAFNPFGAITSLDHGSDERAAC